MKNILIGIHEPEQAEKLIAEGVKLAKAFNARVWITHVAKANPEDFISREAGPQYVYDKREEEQKEEAKLLEQWSREITEKYGISAEGLLLKGSVVEAIKGVVEKHQIDLIIAGHRRRNVFFELFNPNTKKDLVDELNIPLLSVPLA